MGGRPSKPANVIKFEGKGHRSHAELEHREKEEAALLTGYTMRMWDEVKKDKRAKKEFERITSLLKVIGKDDALHENAINRYCLMISECADFEALAVKIKDDIAIVEGLFEGKEIDAVTYLARVGDMYKGINRCHVQIQAKRRMLLDIEKESLLTIAAALRSVPKTPQKQKEKTPLEKAGFGDV